MKVKQVPKHQCEQAQEVYEKHEMNYYKVVDDSWLADKHHTQMNQSSKSMENYWT